MLTTMFFETIYLFDIIHHKNINKWIINLINLFYITNVKIENILRICSVATGLAIMYAPTMDATSHP